MYLCQCRWVWKWIVYTFVWSWLTNFFLDWLTFSVFFLVRLTFSVFLKKIMTKKILTIFFFFFLTGRLFLIIEDDVWHKNINAPIFFFLWTFCFSHEKKQNVSPWSCFILKHFEYVHHTFDGKSSSQEYHDTFIRVITSRRFKNAGDFYYWITAALFANL